MNGVSVVSMNYQQAIEMIKSTTERPMYMRLKRLPGRAHPGLASYQAQEREVSADAHLAIFLSLHVIFPSFAATSTPLPFSYYRASSDPFPLFADWLPQAWCCRAHKPVLCPRQRGFAGGVHPTLSVFLVNSLLDTPSITQWCHH
jgi:hypothetical protein